MPDHRDRDIDMFLRPAQHLRQFLELAHLEQPHVVGNDLPRHAALAVRALDLQQQAFLQIARADAGGVERLHGLQRGFHNRARVIRPAAPFRPASRSGSRLRPDCR